MGSTGRELLDQVYVAFSERAEGLLDAEADPREFASRGGSAERWTDLGDWMGLAARLGAEKVLFVRGEPVAVFSDLGAAPNEANLGELYRRAWCMSEPRCLFVALPGELRVYTLDLPPKPSSPPGEPWRVLENAADVLALTRDLDGFGPDLHGLAEVGAVPTRADRRLIDDLRHVRSHLEGTGLTMAQAHALIGRSILVRYLEDRGVLTRRYFDDVARENPDWQAVLATEGPTPVFGPSRKERFYDRVLQDADFTYALFVRLAGDFNGDLFALGDARGERFGEIPLRLLRDFLLGEAQADQQPLFFWAYDFEVVPLALISSIYEQFYHDAQTRGRPAPEPQGEGAQREGAAEDGEADADEGTTDAPRTDARGARAAPEANSGAGTHYTPASLVHDALRRTLTPARLALGPKVLDLACGSGIFLVEAFRRIVRFEAHGRERKLLPSELRDILRHRIAGVEVNAEAARVAAFSLYLALLDQQEPPDIVAGGRLPYLIHTGARDDEHYGVVVAEDAFAMTSEERQAVSVRVGAKKVYEGRADDVLLLARAGTLDLPLGSFDVVVGNPPWQEAASEKSVPRLWAARLGLPAGEGSYSQLFIHRALSMLRAGGVMGLLVGMKVFWNDRDTSRAFRMHLLARAALRQVVNMAHVRRVFFAKAVAPFAFLLAENRPPAPGERIVLWNARRARVVERLRSMSAVPLDRRVVAQRDMADADHLWKVYWWGSHRDAALAARLGLERTLGDLFKGSGKSNVPQPAYGWQRGRKKPKDKVAMLRELSNKAVQPFGPLRESWFLPPPTGTGRDPDQRIYEGQRLVITHGVREPVGPVARLEDQAFTFRHSFYCIPLSHLPEDEAKLALGVLWSSLGRYKLFMTAGSWGGWHDKVTARDLLGVPVRLKPSWGMPEAEHDDAAARVVAAVDDLRGLNLAGHRALLGPDAPGPYEPDAPEREALSRLDQAIFDLFEASPAERDLVEDFWAESHDLYWKGGNAEAAKRLSPPQPRRGTRADLPEDPARGDLQRYLAAFLDAWNPQMADGTELAWGVAASPGGDAIAVAFVPTVPGTAPHGEAGAEWDAMVARCAAALAQPVSPAFHMNRVVRAAAADGFVVLRENARRLWTASTAREDAEAMFVQLASRRRI